MAPLRRLPRATALVGALLAIGLLAFGCRTAMGLLSGDVDPEDWQKDAHDVRTLAHAVSRANQAITPEDEYYLGRAVAVSLLAQYRYRYLEYDQFRGGQISPGLTQYLYHITKLLVMAAERRPAKGDRPTPLAGYHVIVVNSPVVNATSAPGGYIVITTALLRLARTEDEIAAILAHEICHVQRGHGVEAIRKARWNRVKQIFFSNAAAGVFGDQAAATEFLTEAVADILNRMLREGYAQKAEFEADAYAMRLLSVAGYNPWALYNVLRAMDQQGHGRRTGLYRTHPSPLARMKALYRITPKVRYPTPPPARLARFRVAVGHLPPPA